jgi:outer membrane protein TolC
LSSRARVLAARERAAPVLPANPELSIALGPRIESAPTGLDVEASFVQQLEIAGERSARRDAAERFAGVTEASIAHVRWELQCDVRELFRQALVQSQRVALAERVLGFQREVLGVVQGRCQPGRSGR